MRIEQRTNGFCTPANTISGLVRSGKAGTFVHMCEEGFPQWHVLCALEDALVANKKNKDWTFVAGHIDDMPDVRGWLEYEDWVIIPDKKGVVSIFDRDYLDSLAYDVVAFAPASDESAIALNRIAKAIHGKDYMLGEYL